MDVVILPKRRVIAARAYKKGELVLLAYSSSIGMCKVSKKPTSALELTVAVNDVYDDPELEFYVSPGKYVLPPDQAAKANPDKKVDNKETPQKPSVIPYWLVRTVPDNEIGNLVQTLVTKSFGILAHEESKVEVSFPCWTNTKPVAAGQELCLFKQLEDYQPRPESAAKRTRIAKAAPRSG